MGRIAFRGRERSFLTNYRHTREIDEHSILRPVEVVDDDLYCVFLETSPLLPVDDVGTPLGKVVWAGPSRPGQSSDQENAHRDPESPAHRLAFLPPSAVPTILHR